MLPANTRPVWIPMPMRSSTSPVFFQRSFSSVSARSMSSALCTAFQACSASGTGAPNTAITASPTKSLIMPRCLKMASVMASKYSLRWAAMSAGCIRSDIVVKPRRSENRIDTSRYSPCRLGASSSTWAITSRER